MGKFHESMIEENRALIERLWNHPLIPAIGTGTLPQERIAAVAGQVYLLARTFEQGLARLAALAPDGFRKSLMDCLFSVHVRLESFEETAIGAGYALRSVRMSYETAATASHMLAVAHTRPLEVSSVAVFSAQYALLNSWGRNGRSRPPADLGTDFISLLGVAAQTDWLDSLAGFIDESAETSTQKQVQMMREMFPQPVHYLIRWWNSFFAAGEE